MKPHKSHSTSRKSLFDYILILLLAVISIITFYPLWSVLIISLNDPTNTLLGKLWLLPRVWTLQNYAYLFSGTAIENAALLSVARTVLGAFCSVVFTAAVAYGTSKSYLRGQKVYIGMILFTMYFGGGLIPTFLIIKSIGLYQNFLVYIIPALYSSYYGIIMYSYFRTIPAELEESVKVDGGNDLVIFFRIIIPVSMPMMAAICLFYAVGQWNSWFDTLLYGGGKLMTLQALLVSILRDVAQATKLASQLNLATDIVSFKPTIQSVEATCMMVTAIPIMLVYPFLQKYFVKGIMIGSLKG